MRSARDCNAIELQHVHAQTTRMIVAPFGLWLQLQCTRVHCRFIRVIRTVF